MSSIEKALNNLDSLIADAESRVESERRFMGSTYEYEVDRLNQLVLAREALREAIK